MNAIFISIISLIVLLLIVFVISQVASYYANSVKKGFQSAGTLVLGKTEPIVEIKNHLKLTNTF